jgi:hypothetical protein
MGPATARNDYPQTLLFPASRTTWSLVPGGRPSLLHAEARVPVLEPRYEESNHNDVRGPRHPRFMRAEVCGTLSAVFPLVLLAVMAQRGAISTRLRKMRLYRFSVEASVSTGLFGLVLVVVGQQLGGLTGLWAVVGWGLFVVQLICLGLTVIATHATSELEEEDPQA